MASKMRITMILVIAIVVLNGGARGQPSSSGCTNVLISMAPCLNYISGNSSTPSSGCCTQLATVVRSQPRCLCEVLTGGGSSLGVNINQTLALELPRACNVQTPPTTQCNAASPGDSPSTQPSSPSNPSGSNTVPSTENNGSSDSSSTKFAGIGLLLSLFFVAYATVL